MTNIGELFGIDDELAFVYFGEKSKQGNPMGSFKSLSVFAADGYRESILEGRTYYCRLERKNNQTRFYHATPLYELTLDRIMKEDPDSISKIAEIVYELDRTKFDSEISAIQMREIRNDAEQKYVDKINRLEKDNERLEKELKSREKESHTVITATNGDNYLQLLSPWLWPMLIRAGISCHSPPCPCCCC